MQPDEEACQCVRNLNQQLKPYWTEDEPIDLRTAGRERPMSVPHISLLHMFMDSERYVDLISAGGVIHRTLHDFAYRMRMGRIVLWRDVWVFWLPDERALTHNEPWRALNSAVLDGLDSEGGFPALRLRDHEPHPGITAQEAKRLARYGYAFTYVPHITIAKLQEGAVLPPGFPEVLPLTIDLPYLVVGERGSHGTFRHQLFRHQLWDPTEAAASRTAS